MIPRKWTKFNGSSSNRVKRPRNLLMIWGFQTLGIRLTTTSIVYLKFRVRSSYDRPLYQGRETYWLRWCILRCSCPKSRINRKHSRSSKPRTGLNNRSGRIALPEACQHRPALVLPGWMWRERALQWWKMLEGTSLWLCSRWIGELGLDLSGWCSRKDSMALERAFWKGKLGHFIDFLTTLWGEVEICLF